MPDFQYTARTATDSLQKGVIVATDRAAAIRALGERRLNPILVKEASKGKGLGRIKLPFLKPKVKAKDLVIMTRQLATMINAGVPIAKALRTLSEQSESAALKTAMTSIIAKVEDGAALSDALSAHPKIFSVVYVNMVRAGEAGGILDQILDRLAFQVEKDHDIRGKVRGAMIYPGVITAVTFGAFIFLMTGIVPKLQSIFDEFGSKLPLQTRIMLGISHALQKYGWLMGLVGIGLVIVLIRLTKTKTGRWRWHKLLLKLPIFGAIILKVNVARFARTFSSLTSAGVSVLDGLTVTAHALRNVIIRNAVEKAVVKVKNGQPISTALAEAHIFPAMVPEMTAVGEETGQVDKVLGKVADFYEKEVDRVVANITSIIEPLLIIFLGGLVGLIVGSVFGPISNLSNIVE